MTNWNQILEDAIVGRVLSCLIDEGFRVESSDQDGGGLFVYAWPANDPHPEAGEIKHWVRLVPGNGSDVIVDYTANLETIIKPANDLATQFQQ